MDINFELYKVFYHVARHNSFSEAAAQLFISQSAVSQSIKLLEEKLRTRLFLRTTKQVQLTPAGQLLYQHVEQAFQFLKTGERSIAELQSLERGELRIGASDTICKHYLLPYFKAFHAAYPQVRLKVINRPSPVCAELLQKGLVDIAVVNLPHDSCYRQATVSKCKQLHDIFLAGPAFAHLAHEPLTLPQIAELPLLTLETGTTTRRFLDALFTQHQLTLQPEIELGSIDLLVELAFIGLGIAFISQEYVAKELADNRLFALPLAVPLAPRELGIITHDCLPVPPAAQRFIEMLD